MESAFLDWNHCLDDELLSLREDALKRHIPIVSDEGLVYLFQLVELKQVTRVLEIGTAIGYFSIALAKHFPKVVIDTIERDEKMYQEAQMNLKKFHLESRIHVHFSDALTLDIQELKKTYDLIFIDAAKAQYTKFFEKYEQLLKVNGLIVSDNLLFHGLVEKKEEIQSKNLKAMVHKIYDYTKWLHQNSNYSTTFLPIGDGMAVSIKKESSL